MRADRARAAVLSALPQVLDPTPTAPEVAWSVRPDVGPTPLLGSTGAWVRDGVLVSWDQRFDSTQRLRAVDVRTGDELWTTALTSRPDLGDQAALAGYDPTSCASPDGASVVVCVVPGSWRLGTAQEVVIDGEPAEPEPALEAADLRLRAFDVRTGEAVLDRAVTDQASFVTVDGDVVLAQTPDGTGPSSLERLDPVTGDPRWSVSIPRPDDGGRLGVRVGAADRRRAGRRVAGVDHAVRRRRPGDGHPRRGPGPAGARPPADHGPGRHRGAARGAHRADPRHRR